MAVELKAVDDGIRELPVIAGDREDPVGASGISQAFLAAVDRSHTRVEADGTTVHE